MTNEERVFKVKKVKKYEAEINKNIRELIEMTIIYGMVVANTIISIVVLKSEHNIIEFCIILIYTILASTTTVYCIKEIAMGIYKNMNLEKNMNDINDELELENLRERSLKL